MFAKRILPCLLCSLSVSSAAVGIEVVEGRPDVVTGQQPAVQAPVTIPADETYTAREYTVPTATPRSSSGELFVKIQQLEAEVRELRGMLEQQAYLIDQLTQRRLDDYIDLDRRISELQGGVASTPSSNPSAISPTASPGANSTVATAAPITTGRAPSPPAAPQADLAKTAYRDAYQKVKDRQFDDAKVALVAFVSDFPDSHYVPNAHFWLGELYYLGSELPRARDSFYILVTEHSNHRKVADAKFKLGKIYHQLGESDQARVMLQSVISDHPDSKAANPAREYLKNSLR